MAEEKKSLSGNTSMLLLQLMSERDMYGYEIIETLRKRSENVFNLKAGTMYPLLHGLESKGLLQCYETESQGKIRRYYSITQKGRSVLAEKKQEWKPYSQAVNQVMGGALYGNA